MPNIDQHPAGSFSWIELGTTDQSTAEAFYGALFGWSANHLPVGPDMVYTMMQLEGRDAAAVYGYDAAQRARNVPPHWNLYVAVNSADDAAASATQLGGKVVHGPFDVMDVGRMAILQDPTGAVFSVWQAKKHSGTGIAGVPGTLCWADLCTPQTEAARAFYSALFGWKIASGKDDPYLHIQNGETYIGGVPPADSLPPGVPAHWLPYFAVTDCDATVAQAAARGGKVHMGPMSMEGVGRMAVLADPQGAVFALFTPAPRG